MRGVLCLQDNRQWQRQQQLTRESLLLLSSCIMTSPPHTLCLSLSLPSSLLTPLLLIPPPSLPDLALRDFYPSLLASIYSPLSFCPCLPCWLPCLFRSILLFRDTFSPFIICCVHVSLSVCVCASMWVCICVFQPLLLKNVTSEKLSKYLHYRPYVNCV